MYVYHTPPTNVNIDKVLNGTLFLLDIYYDYGTINFYIDPFDGNRSKLHVSRSMNIIVTSH